MKEQCDSCEYQGYCFWGLKFVRMYMSKDFCKQGRKRKVRNATTRTDNPVQAV